MLHPGWYPRAYELLTYATRQFAPKIVDLSARFFGILFYSSL